MSLILYVNERYGRNNEVIKGIDLLVSLLLRPDRQLHETELLGAFQRN
jgi:hypothetical protein